MLGQTGIGDLAQVQLESIQAMVNAGISHMEQALERYVQELKDLILIESPSSHAPGLNQMADSLAVLLQRVGMTTTIVEHPSGNAVLGELQGDKLEGPTILLLGHHDTVHPLGVAAARLQIDGDKLIGPGTVDMKAGLLHGIYALEILAAQEYRSFRKIIFLSMPDEEISERFQTPLLQQVVQREKPLVLTLEEGRSLGNVVVQRKGCSRYKLTAIGLSAHSGTHPERGLNAVLELAHQIVQFCSINRWREGLTINAGPIRGGILPNIVPDFAETLLEIRFLHTQDRLETEQRWQQFLEQQLVPGVQLTLTTAPNMMPPMEENEGTRLIAEFVKLVAEEILGVPFDPEMRGGASDASNTSAFGCASVDGLGAIGGHDHNPEEFILISAVPRKIALLAGVIVGLTNTPDA